MTLIAAFKINNIPFILADMLLTSDLAPEQLQFMPLSPNRNSPPNGRAPAGVVSKLLILNGGLAIAFAGSLAAGTKLFADLHRRFSNSTPSEDALSGALQSWNVDKIISKHGSLAGSQVPSHGALSGPRDREQRSILYRMHFKGQVHLILSAKFCRGTDPAREI
jgi:hypothetical protein